MVRYSEKQEVNFLRSVFSKKMLQRRAAAFIAYGQRAKEYLTDLGAKSEKIFIARNTVDTRFFSEQTDLERKRSLMIS